MSSDQVESSAKDSTTLDKQQPVSISAHSADVVQKYSAIWMKFLLIQMAEYFCTTSA